ncbi:S8 family serine peptidase, partial [candidate division KSB1 bacterium]|nr:S8 family serine peptidase [candidate division KSB1 bacterium]NIU26261.1 S8 family serine peptidase [candidate division KSB1 bacterium]NIU89679.1 S8 family serine peptidase [candidate division KSB1 bacterium]NIV91812.1 S8 family serine peptidase [candidate division KSB1 bacterium]NIW20124.1 S8 family serine peptidase [candidate division KSB1 bacterium]
MMLERALHSPTWSLANHSTLKAFTAFLCLLTIYGATLAQRSDYVAGEIVVKLKAAPKYLNFSPKLNTKVGLASLDAINRAIKVRRVQRLFKTSLPQSFAARRFHPERIIKIEFSETEKIAKIISAYEHDPNVEYVQPNYVHRIHAIPDDPLLSEQISLNVLQAEEAWQLQLASPDVIVGVIDTGLDYEHEDLRDALWMNEGEDLDGNGRIDSTDFNGLDDDGNGFVDDIRGWDFTDAPTFPDGGDFEMPDNDPFDENGHGTSVAGIVGASGDNGLGIAGLAYGCRIMNLRAGTSRGLLEEDDVASAIVYAVENGAQIINMSFGDNVASPLLRDVIQFAYEQNCVLVASAGNSNTDKIHFPSGFTETVSVGATNADDRLAGFSNYGSSVDLVAPGVNVLTTERADNYGSFSGTSAAAPFVSGLAALILSRTPEMSNEAVKGLLISTTDDLGQQGWDNFYASGRMNAFKAVQSAFFSIVRIDYPKVDQGFANGPIHIRGTASGGFLEAYNLQIGVGETPEEWTELTRVRNRQVIDEPIWDLDIVSLSDTLYTLRLIAENKDGTALEDKVRFFIDRTSPVISEVRQTSMLDSDRPSVLLEFSTDDLCVAAVHYRASGSTEPFQVLKLPFRTTSHRVNLTQNVLNGEMQFFIEATNGAGLASISDNQGVFFTADLSAPAIGALAVERRALTLPSGFLLDKSADFDRDGFKEIVLNQYDANFNFGSVKIFEFSRTQFEEIFATEATLIPRDWGDSDGDGLLEILAGRGGSSFILEAPSQNEPPSELVWTDNANAWASQFSDLDQDGLGEIILRLDDLFTVWETTGDNDYALVDSFPNPTAGANSVGVPRSEVGDFDGDGQMEILFGDFDGDIYIYEGKPDGTVEFIWSDSLPLLDTIAYLTFGDYDGDGIPEFAVGSHTDPALNTESTFNSGHWLYRLYKRDGDNSFRVAWEQAFFGFQSPRDFDSGISSGDIDNDGRAEVLIGVFPDFYVVDYAPAAAEYRVVWHTTPNRSNRTLVADFDNDSRNEFYFNTGTEIASYQVLSEFVGPATPLALKVRPLDANLVELSWQSPDKESTFQIYRGISAESQTPLVQINRTRFLDTTVQNGITYWYFVTAIDSTKTPPESLPSVVVNVTPGPKPFVVQAQHLSLNQIQVTFSEAMDSSVKNQTNFEIESVGTPVSSIVNRLGQEVILTSPTELSPGAYRIVARNVFDLDGTPIDSTGNFAEFQVLAQARAPYLVRADLVSQNELRLEFNVTLDFASASRLENYSVEPDVQIATATLSPENPQFVLLRLDSESPIGPFGIEYVITIRNVQSQDGTPIKAG